ncbi:low molecular weight phosphatase family protein [Mycobacterium frederiksbergense]|nr:low molecular weight phosphatase family protein [Mycolicibacterium frederiksbergense]
MHVLFVCTGNICRSPTAERIAIAYCAQAGIDDVAASSAGTHAVIGHPIHSDAGRVLVGLGGDASNFAARQLTSKMAASADLILTMTRAHRDSVLEVAPRQMKRTFSLTEASRLVLALGAHTVADLANLRPQLIMNDVPDIPDPIGQRPDVFAAVGQQIADLLPPVLELCRPE